MINSIIVIYLNIPRVKIPFATLSKIAYKNNTINKIIIFPNRNPKIPLLSPANSMISWSQDMTIFIIDRTWSWFRGLGACC